MSDLSPLPPMAGARPRIEPTQRLTKRQKAAVIVHLLVSGGVDPGLRDLPPERQRALVTDFMSLRFVDRATLAATIAEFAAELDDVGLHFPRDAAKVITALEGQLSMEVIEQIMAQVGGTDEGAAPGAWSRIAALEDDALLTMLMEESDEVASVLVSKLEPMHAAALMAKLPSWKAQSISLAFVRVGGLTPEAVGRIGMALGRQAETTSAHAFPESAVARVAAILNASAATQRSEILARLESAERDFAAKVRAAIFTFENVPERVAPRDVGKVLRALDNDEVIALLGGSGPTCEEAVAFVLANVPTRLADQIREDIAEREAIPADEAERAASKLVAEIQRLDQAGEIRLTVPEVDN